MARRNENPKQIEQTPSPQEGAGRPALAVFSKNKILGLRQYANRADLLRVLLKPDKAYTIEAVTTVINDFMKGKVK